MLRLRSALVAIAGIVATWQSMEGYSLAQFPGRGRSPAGVGRANSISSSSGQGGCSNSSGTTSSLQQLGTGSVGTTSAASLSSDLAAAVSNGRLTSSQARVLSQDVALVLNPLVNRQIAVTRLQTDLAALPTATRLSTQEIQTITNDINTVLQSVLASTAGRANLVNIR